MLEAELRLAYQNKQSTGSSPVLSKEAALVEYLSKILPKNEKKKQKQLPPSVHIRLARQAQDRMTVQRQEIVQPEEPTQPCRCSESPFALREEINPKSERELLLEDPDMRFVIVKNTALAHDRDCPEVAKIPDLQFSMTGIFPTERWFCDKCYWRALIRSGLVPDQANRMELYCEAFQRLQAGSDSLRTLMLDCGAQLYGAEPDRVFLKVGDENWLILAEDQLCRLYQIVSGDSRQNSTDYSKLRQDWLGIFDKIVFRISQFPLIKRRYERMRSRKRVETVRNVKRLSCFSVRYQYYIYADRLRWHQTLGLSAGIPMKILKIREYSNSPYTTVVCRIRRRDQQLFLTAVKDMKQKCPIAECDAYADFCGAHLPSDDRQRLLSILKSSQ